jgi:hypothetical protein
MIELLKGENDKGISYSETVRKGLELYLAFKDI